MVTVNIYFLFAWACQIAIYVEQGYSMASSERSDEAEVI